MDIAYSARIVDITGHEAGAPRRVVVRVYVHEDGDSTGHLLAEHELTDISGADCYEPGETDAKRVLADNGWRLTSAGWDPYNDTQDTWVADVAPADWAEILRHTTAARQRAKDKADAADGAWRAAVRAAQLEQEAGRSDLGADRIAGIIGKDRSRVYQLRHGTR